MEIKETDLLVRNNEILSSDMDGETVMMSVENSEYYSLSPIGTKIWEILVDEMSFGSLIEVLMKEYKVAKDICTTDTIEFLQELIEKNLVEVK